MRSLYNIFETKRAGSLMLSTGFPVITFYALFLAFSISGCKKLVTVAPPPTSVLGASAYSSDLAAISVLNGLYAQQMNSGTVTNAGTIPSVSFFTGLSSDEFTLLNTVTNATQLAYYRNSLSASVPIGSEFWTKIYPNIFTCNAAIEGLTASTTLTPSVKQQLLGEAKFMRAFFYFYLVNFYGDVPLQLSTDYTVNDVLSRAPAAQVWQQIIADLKDAQNLLSNNYHDATLLANTTERVRPTSWAATALLARTYLYTKDFANAEIQATNVINNTTYYALVPLNSVFLKNSQEAIWQLQPVNTSWNTEDARFFIYPTAAGPTTSNPVYLSSSLLNSFEVNDLRKVNGNWINSITVSGTTYSYPFKYKVYLSNAAVTSPASLNEYYTVLRLGEQYLIRAEARAQQGSNLTGAATDLNAIRTRAGLPNIVASTQATLLTAIQHERQVELFSELGQRWLDLKRTGTVDGVMNSVAPLKGTAWNSYQQLFPVYPNDIQKDANLMQNAGY